MDNDHVMDPQENPTQSDHLPVAGEVGNGPVPYHDPVTQPTDDSADDNISSPQTPNSPTYKSDEQV